MNVYEQLKYTADRITVNVPKSLTAAISAILAHTIRSALPEYLFTSPWQHISKSLEESIEQLIKRLNSISFVNIRDFYSAGRLTLEIGRKAPEKNIFYSVEEYYDNPGSGLPGSDPDVSHMAQTKREWVKEVVLRSLEENAHSGMCAYKNALQYNLSQFWYSYLKYAEPVESESLTSLVRFNETMSGYRLGQKSAWLIRKPIRLQLEKPAHVSDVAEMSIEYRDGWGI